MRAIDLTDRFHTTEFMRNGPEAWAVDRREHPFRNVILHHTTSAMSSNGIPYAYGIRTDGEPTTQAQEEAAILSLARDHRARLNIGPGYTGVVFQSGRGYWVGKAGTQRRHTTNSNGRTDGRTWNFDSVAICMFGNMDYAPITPGMKTTIIDMVTEVISWSITRSPVEIMGHGDTWNTACPGIAGNLLVAEIRKLIAKPTDPTSSQIATARNLIGEARTRLEDAERLLGG